MKNQVRAFIAVPLPSAVRATVAQFIRSLQTKIDGTKWVETENLHITLKFLGDVPFNDLPVLIKAMRRAAVLIEPFDIEISGSGAFPNVEHPKIIWVGCRQGTEELTTLATALEEEVHKIGFAQENRRFSPHLTIGRVKASSVPLMLSGLPASFGYCSADEIVLFSSELTKRGPIYEELATVPLG
jgi:2'-5' RNA ligase